MNHIVLRHQPIEVGKRLPNVSRGLFLIVLLFHSSWKLAFKDSNVDCIDRISVAKIVDWWSFSRLQVMGLRVAGYRRRWTVLNQQHLVLMLILEIAYRFSQIQTFDTLYR